jgi:hypothetical protein
MLDRAARTTGWTLLLGALALAPAAVGQSGQAPAPAPAAPAAPATAPTASAAPAAPAARPCSAPEKHQFDFWIGNWEVKNPKGELEGTNLIDSIQGGCAIQEHWDDGKGMTGTSFNMYSVSTHKWHQTWIDNAGSVLLLSGELTGGKMVLSGERTNRAGAKILDRISWTPVDANHVRQFWEVSRDGGKTWTSNFDGMYTRK